MNCKFMLLDKNQIEKIKPLWNRLNELHLKDSRYFKDHYKKFTFEERCRKFIEMDDDNIRIEIICDNERVVGYCISSFERNPGEIDSLFIEEGYRNYGYGSRLVEESISWLRSRNCNKIVVAVAEGHETVFDFYRKHGFYPRMTYLQLKSQT